MCLESKVVIPAKPNNKERLNNKHILSLFFSSTNLYLQNSWGKLLILSTLFINQLSWTYI